MSDQEPKVPVATQVLIQHEDTIHNGIAEANKKKETKKTNISK